MSNISPNPGELSAELVQALKAANSVSEMQEIQRAWLVEHGAERDRFSPDKLILDNFKAPEENATGTVSRVVPIGGVKRLFTASSLLELEKEIGAALQAVAADAAGGTGGDANAERSTVQAKDPTSGRFIDPTNPAVQADLKARLVRGEITSEQYIAAQPQLLDATMKERYGLDPEKISNDRFQWTWAKATDEFLKSPAGASWPGGDQNKEILARVLQENDLTDQPSVETLTRAYQHMKEHGLLVANPEIETRKEISEATSFEDLRQSAWKSVGGRPSSFWSR